METEILISLLNNVKKNINFFLDYSYSRSTYQEEISKCIKQIIEIEEVKDLPIVDRLIDTYEIICSGHDTSKLKNDIDKSEIIPMIEEAVEGLSKECYGNLYIDYEEYKLKILMYYKDGNDDYNDVIAYMAGSFYTDQEYRTFLANIQKGKKSLRYQKVTQEYENDLSTIKNGYISRVKKSTKSNTQDGYHADFHLDNDRFFLISENDNPVDIIYNWIVKNSQAAILEEWKTYFYNSLVEGGYIIDCNVINYTKQNLKGIILSEEVNTDLIRNLRKEGLESNEISIPREPVDLDPSMSFVDAMTKFVIPEITEGDTLYKVGDEISDIINSPIVFKRNNTLVKTSLYPKQKIIAQGMLNGIKSGRNSIIMNLGMGTGKTYSSIKLIYAAIREVFNKDAGRIAVYAQSHLIPKWERQFKEALPDVPLKFITINSYKDVMDLKEGPPEGIEVYLLPKDKVKRKYLEEYATSRYKYNLSKNGYSFYKKSSSKKDTNIFIANEVKLSEMRVIARMLEKYHRTWICLAKEVINEDNEIIGYKVVTTSKLLKQELGDNNGKAYDFFIDNLDLISEYESKIDIEYKDKHIPNTFIQNGLVCPCCGGFQYNSVDDQLSEDDYTSNLHISPKTKSERNKKCSNYIKADGTPLTSFERKLIIKGDLNYIVNPDSKYPYIDENEELITDYDTLKLIKSGNYQDYYTIVLKKCETSLWTAADRKGYRTVNSIDMIRRNFGKNYFLGLIADESHLYSAESSQGESFSKLCKISKVKLALTGTLTGGKASHLFYALYRMIPHKISKYYKYNEVSKFINHYGRRKKVTKEYLSNDQYNKSGQGKIVSSGWNEIAGISPMLYSHFLSDIMVSRKLEDMNMDLPELSYYKHGVEMSPELQEGYETLKSDILSFMAANKHLNLGGLYLNALLSYPDKPLTEPLMYEGMLISNPEPIDIENILLPKEVKLIETVKREIKQGRRVVVYVQFTGDKEVDKRLEKILKNEGIKVANLKSSVKTELREQWIEDRYKEGVTCILTNPMLVQTGLDIIGYATMYFYEMSYDSRVVRQAESRARRVGQTKDCRVFYSFYYDTMQFDALKLVGSKKKASLAVEGVFAEDMLSDMGDVGDGGASVLYKSLVGKVKLKEDDLDFFSSEEEITEIIPIDSIDHIEETIRVISDITDTSNTQLSLFTITKESISKLKTKGKKSAPVGQLSLFEI